MLLVDTLRIGKRALAARQLVHPAPSQTGSAQANGWLEEVRREGICVVPGFFTPDECAEIREDFVTLFDRYPEAVQKCSNGADWRVFGAEKAAPSVRRFTDDTRLNEMAKCFLGEGARPAFTLGNRIQYSESNLGSGDGWHRDSFFNQFKAIVYLTDVEEGNGPFEYIKRSHGLAAKFRDHFRHDIPLHSSRVEDRVVESMIANEPDRHRVVCGAAGSLVLADTTGIHRGRPLREGTRIALSNYFYPEKNIGEPLFEHFKPVLGYHVPV